MIVLKHLTLEQFRLLQKIDLHFPQHGSILLQGPNEAGKSALLESIYFALYGKSLSLSAKGGKRERGLDELIHYGAAQARVSLTLSIATSELAITRTVKRGKGQQVTLRVQTLGMPEEEAITDLETANERIIAELGLIDGDVLRDSYYIEQKGLNRLESLTTSEREAALRKLVGLEKLARVTSQFKVTPEDEANLADCALRLKLAEIQARIPTASERLGAVEAGLDAIAVSEDLSEIELQEADIAEQELSLELLRNKRADLKVSQSRLRQLKRAAEILSEIITTYDAMTEAQQRLPELEQQIAELERREREELPGVEKRVGDLAELTRSFSTLERMSNDLLTAVNTIRELEKELKQYEDLQRSSGELDARIVDAQLRLDQARQSLHELEERRRAGRPQLEARLERLRELTEKVSALHQGEEQLVRRDNNQSLAEENSARLEKTLQDLHETEQELMLAETEAQRDQQRVDELETRRRQIAMRQQLQAWKRLKSVSLSLDDAEQRDASARQRQEQLRETYEKMKQAAHLWRLIAIGAGVLGIVLAVAALLLFLAAQQMILSLLVGILALVTFTGVGLSLQNHTVIHKEEEVADQRLKGVADEITTIMEDRDSARRIFNDGGSLTQIEQEIRSLGGTVPNTLDEAESQLGQLQDDGGNAGNLDDLQQQIMKRRHTAEASRGQADMIKEAAETLQKERARLEEQRRTYDLEDIQAKIRASKIAIEDLQNAIAAQAGQEGLPIPVFDASLTATVPISAVAAGATVVSLPDFEQQVRNAIAATEREMAALDAQSSVVSNLARQVQEQQEGLERLLEQKRALLERSERFQSLAPTQQIERAREQQAALSSALHNLQDSLRQRVKTLDVAFGQAAIGGAEAAARRQLEALQIVLGERVEMQNRRSAYLTTLKDGQDTLAESYNRLAKFSGSVGSWIVPPNPFAETLVALRLRCGQEIEEANESEISKQLDTLQAQEHASRTKVELCRQEIENAQERVATMLAQHRRPPARGYRFTDVATVWPLVGEYSIEDRERLETERDTLEQDLRAMEQQELELSRQLHTAGEKLDLDEARARMKRQERHYETRKRGDQLVNAVSERLMRKMQSRIEYFMQHLVPPLTGGRYRDVHLVNWLPEPVLSSTDEEDENENISDGLFHLRVWDTAAGEYVEQSALSGGAADQLSLALRVAFAIAALPRELQAAPGFLLLDEPLLSFDQGRTKALVDIVTGQMLGQHFEQILLVSQSNAFDPAMFTYHVAIENGAIASSNLPAPPAAEAAPQPPSRRNGSRSGAKPDTQSVSLPVTPLPESLLVE
jgi:DNA repair exonuclease SbcCD ATPase subunit